jgi:hypothetical protein
MGRKGSHRKRIFDASALVARALTELAVADIIRMKIAAPLKEHLEDKRRADLSLSDDALVNIALGLIPPLVYSIKSQNKKDKRKAVYERSLGRRAPQVRRAHGFRTKPIGPTKIRRCPSCEGNIFRDPRDLRLEYRGHRTKIIVSVDRCDTCEETFPRPEDDAYLAEKTSEFQAYIDKRYPAPVEIEVEIPAGADSVEISAEKIAEAVKDVASVS